MKAEGSRSWDKLESGPSIAHLHQTTRRQSLCSQEAGRVANAGTDAPAQLRLRIHRKHQGSWDQLSGWAKQTNQRSIRTHGLFPKWIPEINHSEPTNVVLTPKDETVALQQRSPPTLSWVKPTQTQQSDISVGLDEVTPHPGLEPVVLVEGRGVSAVLLLLPPAPGPEGQGLCSAHQYFKNCRLGGGWLQGSRPQGCKVRSSKAQALFTRPGPIRPSKLQSVDVGIVGAPQRSRAELVLSYGVDEEPVLGKEVLPEQSPETIANHYLAKSMDSLLVLCLAKRY